MKPKGIVIELVIGLHLTHPTGLRLDLVERKPLDDEMSSMSYRVDI